MTDGATPPYPRSVETERSAPSETSLGLARQPVLGVRKMRYFLAVAEERHFGHAADRLRIAQSGLSQQIRKLEHALGTELFTRDSRQVELTEGGKTLLPLARQMLELVARAEESMRAIAAGKGGVLRLATIAAGYFPGPAALLDAFRSRFPEVQVELYPGFSLQNREALRRRDVDLAFVALPFEGAESIEASRYLRLGTIELMVILPEGHPLASLDRIPRTRLIEEEVVTWARAINPAVIDHIHRSFFGTTAHPRLVEVGDTTQNTRVAEITRRSVVGIGLAPEAEIRPPGVVYRPLEEPTPSVEYGVLWPDAHASPFVDTFVEVAREVMHGASGAG